MGTNNNELDFESTSNLVELFLAELRTASTKEIASYSGKMGQILSKITNSHMSSQKQNELFRRLAFTLFQRPEADSLHKEQSYWLDLLRIATFHNFEETKITAKLFLKAYSSLFQEAIEKRPRSTTFSLSNSIFHLFRGIGMRPIRKPYTTNDDSNVTRVEMGTGKYFFDLISRGQSDGYRLNDYKSTGIFVTPWNDQLIPEGNRIERTLHYADQGATKSFDCPVRVVLDIPNKYLCRAWLHNSNHSNVHELSIVKEELHKIRESGTVKGTVYEYMPFRVLIRRPPLTQSNSIATDLNLNEADMQTLYTFIEEKQSKLVTLPSREGVQFTFGQSTLVTDESCASGEVSPKASP